MLFTIIILISIIHTLYILLSYNSHLSLSIYVYNMYVYLSLSLYIYIYI